MQGWYKFLMRVAGDSYVDQRFKKQVPGRQWGNEKDIS